MSDVEDNNAFILECNKLTTQFLLLSKNSISEQFGQGFSDQHPEIVASYLQSLTHMYLASLHKNGMDSLFEDLEEKLEWISNSIDSK